MTDVKFCRDCKWAERDKTGSLSTYASCLRPQTPIAYNRVSGEPILSRLRCNDERFLNREYACGESAKFFEPYIKPVQKPLFKRIFGHD